MNHVAQQGEIHCSLNVERTVMGGYSWAAPDGKCLHAHMGRRIFENCSSFAHDAYGDDRVLQMHDVDAVSCSGWYVEMDLVMVDGPMHQVG